MSEQEQVEGLRTRFVQVEQQERSLAARERVIKVAEQNIQARFDSVTAREEAAKLLEARLQDWATALSLQTERTYNFAHKFIEKTNQLGGNENG